jgi:hypothetical protein
MGVFVGFELDSLPRLSCLCTQHMSKHIQQMHVHTIQETYDGSAPIDLFFTYKRNAGRSNGRTKPWNPCFLYY